MATLLNPAQPEVAAAGEAGREILTRLGARPFLERLEMALVRSTAATEPLRPATRESAPAT